MRREISKESIDIAAEIKRLETALEKESAEVGLLKESLQKQLLTTENQAEQITSLTISNTRLEEKVLAGTAQKQATEAVLQAVNSERERDRADLKEERARWEEATVNQTLAHKQLQAKLENNRQILSETKTEVSTLKTENARLDERAKAAESRVSDSRKQHSELQKQFAALAKQKDLKEPSNLVP